MTTPVRLQLSRAKGFDLQALSRTTNGLPAVKVDRSTPWGNPYRVWLDTWGDRAWWVSIGGCHHGPLSTKAAATDEAVRRFRTDIEESRPRLHVSQAQAPHRTDIIKALRGRNLGCWCKPGDPCHADVLLAIANGPLCEEVG